MANLELGKVDFRGTFEIQAGQLYLLNTLKDPTNSGGQINFIADRIVIFDGVQLRAQSIFLYGEESVEMHNDVLLTSTMISSCTTQ